MNTWYEFNNPFEKNGSELYHHGIKGQRWGVRRYQNADGSLTAAGRKHYGQATTLKKAHNEYRKGHKYLKRQMGLRKAATVAGATASTVGAGLGAGVISGNPLAAYGTALGTSYVSSKMAEKKLKEIRGQTNERYKDLITKYNPVKLSDIEIEAGTKFNRTSLKEKEEGNERMYVGYEKDSFGKEFYQNDWPNMLRKIEGHRDAKVYANTYEVNTKILAPSYEKRKAAAFAVLNADKKMKTELGKAFAMDQTRAMTGVVGAKKFKDFLIDTDSQQKKDITDFYNGVYKKVTEREKYGNEEDYFFFKASIPTSSKLMNAYMKELKSQGYDAVFDDNANTEASFIVFDPSMLTQTGSTEIAKKK